MYICVFIYICINYQCIIINFNNINFLILNEWINKFRSLIGKNPHSQMKHHEPDLYNMRL